MIDEICDIFVAFPTYHGDTKTVEIHARADKSGLLELNFGKNSDNIQRTSNSSDIITRLYVEGEYGDYGYVGIDDVNLRVYLSSLTSITIKISGCSPTSIRLRWTHILLQ